MKKILAFLFTVLFLVGCSTSKTPKNRLVMAIESDVTTFDPRLAADANSQRICRLLFNGLMKSNEQMEIVPDLAEKYEKLSDTTYKFYLRKGVKFHSGEPLTAADVVYTYSSIMKGLLPSPHNSTFQKIKSVTALLPDVVLIELSERFAPILVALNIGIVPKALAEKLGDKFGAEPVGTGPYKMGEFKSDAHILLEASNEYYGDRPKLPFLEFKVLKDDNVRILQLIKGTVDIVQNDIPPVLLDMLKQKKNLVIETAPSIKFNYMGMNLEDKILSNVKVRRALAHAVDREEIIKHKLGGFATIANTLLAPVHWAHSKDVDTYKYDLEAAKKLLDEAGYPEKNGVRFKLSYKTSTQKIRIDIASLIAQQLRKAGIEVNVTPFEWGTFFRDIKTGNFQIYTLAWVGVTEPDLYYNIYHSEQFPPVGANRNRYINAEIDRLTEEGRVTMGNEHRKAIYAKIQKIVSVDLPYVPLWYEDNIVVRQKNVEGYKIRPDAGFQNVVYVTK